MMERWLAIPGYVGLYEVSDLGRVRALRNIRGGWNVPRAEPLTIKQHLRSGYPFVNLSREGRGRSFSVHTLVALTFIGPRPDGFVARHLDGDRSSPALGNLAYGTYAENEADKVTHGTRPHGEKASFARLTEAQVREILGLYRPGSMTLGAPALGRRYGVHAGTISHIIVGRTWRHIDRSSYPNVDLPPVKPPKRHRKFAQGICLACGTAFTSRSHRPNPKACSKACISILISRNNRWKARMPTEGGPLFVVGEP